jgi:hypothetical protein
MVNACTLPADLLNIETISLPVSFDDVTAELLTQLLQGAAPGVVVESLAISDVTEGTGSRARLTLAYNQAGADAGLPKTMWLKSWLNDLKSFHLAAGSIIGEIVFYRFAGRLPVRAAGSYYSGIDASGQGLVLMEDMVASKARFLSSDMPLDLQQVRDGLDQLARLHGAYWDIALPDPSVLWPTLPNRGPLAEIMRDQVVPAQAEALRQPHLEGKLPAELLVDGVFGNAMLKLFDLASQAPLCLIHFDPHLGNLALNEKGEAVFVDWQFFRIGNWSHDVSYFVASALTPENRRAWERDLLRYYLERLAAHGGTPPSFDAAWKAYGAGQLYGVFAWVNTHLSMQTMETIYTILSRHLEAMTDLGTLELLS